MQRIDSPLKNIEIFRRKVLTFGVPSSIYYQKKIRHRVIKQRGIDMGTGHRSYRMSTKAGKKKTRRTKESGQAIGQVERSESLTALRKRTKARGDTTLAMKRIYDGGWEYDEEVAKRRNSATTGSYIYLTLNVDIDPEDAQELFFHHNYDDRQRAFDNKWAFDLSKDITTVHNLAFAVGPSGKALLVNGQHNLGAIANRGITTQAVVTIHMCRNEVCVADLYNTFDFNKKRSFQNSIHASRESLTYEGKDNNLAKWCQAVATAENGFARRIREGRVDQIKRAKREEVQAFAAWMDSHVTEPLQRKLVPQGIGAAFFAMWQSDPENAKKFAICYFTGENLTGKHPALVMRDKMFNRPKGEHAHSVCRFHAEMMYTVWRKFCLDQPLLHMRCTTALPTPDRWRIYKSATKSMQITLGGIDQKLRVANV